MTSEKVKAKAARLVEDGKVQITYADHDAGVLNGIVEGDTGTYTCTIDPGGARCSCAYPEPRCSHLWALLRADELARKVQQ